MVEAEHSEPDLAWPCAGSLSYQEPHNLKNGNSYLVNLQILSSQIYQL